MKEVGGVAVSDNLPMPPRGPQSSPVPSHAPGHQIARGLSYFTFTLAACGYAIVYMIALRTGSTGLVHALFWLCTLLALGAVQMLIRGGSGDREAALISALIGALFYLPKYFRSPHLFVYHDELAHWYATGQLLAGHGAFVANPDTPIVQYYPGLHVLTAALCSMTGLSVFAAGNVVCAWAHVVTCLAVYGICRGFTRRPGMALSAVVLFAANPAFFYFDAQFSYETLGMVFFAVILLACMRLAMPTARVSWAEVCLIGFMSTGLVVIHHVTSYLLAATLVILAIVSLIMHRRAIIPRRNCQQLAATAAVSVAASTTWLLVVARGTLVYIRGPVIADLAAFWNYVRGGTQLTKPRTLFAGAPIPIYEVYLSYASIFVLFGLYIWALTRLRWPHYRRDPRQWVLWLLGAMYFASLPVVFVFADQTAKRPWAFAFIGLAVVYAPLVYARITDRRWLMQLASLGLVVIIYVGGVVTFSGYDIRFPDAYNAASDALSTTSDLISAAVWLDKTYGDGNPVIANETDANVFGAYGRQDPKTYQNYGYEPWRVVFPMRLDSSVYAELQSDDARFIVIDRRMGMGPADQVSYYFSLEEPASGTGIRPFNQSSLDKFQYGPFDEIYNNGNIVIWEYRDWAPPLPTEGTP